MYSIQCTVYGAQCTVYSVQCTVYSAQCVECTTAVDNGVPRTRQYGEGGLLSFYKATNSLVVTSHVNACTFIHLVYSHVCFCITSDVLVPTCSFRRARSDVLVPTCSFRRARFDVLVPTFSFRDDSGISFPVHLLP